MTNRSHRPVCNLLHPSALCFARPLARLGAQERNSSWLKANALSEVEYTEAVVPRFRGRLFHWQNGRSPYTDEIREASSPRPGLHPGYELLWWIRGLPAPESRSRITLDGQSHLAQLEQDGWKVEYQRYTEQNGYALPERLKLYGQDLEVTLVIKDWQPRQLGQ